VLKTTFLQRRQICYNVLANRNISLPMGMTGFDGRGWFRNASREAPNS
jgi:hypothetical protein